MSGNRIPVAPGEKPFVDFTAEAQDADHFMIFESTGAEIPLPAITIGDYTWQITKFHVLLGIAAVITAAVLLWLGRKMRSGEPPRGVVQGIFESLVYFVRDQVARPAIDHDDGHGHVHHDGDRYVPFLTTTFLFILVANLLGMIPFLGSPTASIAVTATLSLITFVYVHFWGIKKNGAVGYFKSYIPHIELEGPAKVLLIFLVPLIMILEMMTPFIRAFVLAVRLFANMLAGHVAVFVLLFFIHMVSHEEWVAYHKGPDWLYYLIAPMSVAIVTALSLLELMVAALQAFIFTLLVAIFIGLARHPAH
jgi:F-type H+-transporting ATPase subunit a